MSRTGQMKTKLMDVVDSLDALERTPTAFRWTPAMSAIWPKDYRPTMTGLLAMWEAMHEAAEYSSPKPLVEPVTDANGWVHRYEGDVRPDGRVNFVCADGYSDYGAIPPSWWGPDGNPDDRIIQWKRS